MDACMFLTASSMVGSGMRLWSVGDHCSGGGLMKEVIKLLVALRNSCDIRDLGELVHGSWKWSATCGVV